MQPFKANGVSFILGRVKIDRTWAELRSKTYIVEVDVDTTKVGQDEVSNGVCALDRLRVTVECGEKPRVFGSYELA